MGKGPVPVLLGCRESRKPSDFSGGKGQTQMLECPVSPEQSISQMQREGNEGTGLGQAVRPRNL